MGDDEPMKFTRALVAPEYWLLVVVGIGGAAGLSAWIVIPLAVTGLCISSMPKYIALWRRARAVGGGHVWWETVALSMLNNVGAVCAAYLLGVAMRWLWS